MTAPRHQSVNVLAYERNFHALDSIRDDEERGRVWEAVIRYLRQSGVRIPEEGMETYESFFQRLRRLGDHLPDRVSSLRSALELIGNQDRFEDPERASGLGVERPILVMIGAEADHNGAFLARNGFTSLETTVRENQFDVLYVEAGTDTEAEAALLDIHERTDRRIHTLIIAGHGVRRALFLGDPMAPSPTESAEESIIDPADFRDGEWSGLDRWMAPDGQILLLSCSTGAPAPRTANAQSSQNGDAGEVSDANLADTFRRAAPGRDVYAPEGPTRVPALKFDDETGAIRVTWDLLER